MDPQDEKMDQLPYEETFVAIKRGEVIKGTVVKIDTSAVLVDIGGKTEGVLPFEELGHSPTVDPHTSGISLPRR